MPSLRPRAVGCGQGMGLRGLAWLGPAGMAMHRAGYGWTVGFGGVLMAAVYDGADRLSRASSHLGGGKSPWPHTCPYLCTAQFFSNPETVWGMYMWLLFLAAALSRPPPPPADGPGAHVSCSHHPAGSVSPSPLSCFS